LAVKSSHTKLWIGWSNVFTAVSWLGLGTTDGNTLKPKTKYRSWALGSLRSTANPSRPLVSAFSKSMPNEIVFVPETAKI